MPLVILAFYREIVVLTVRTTVPIGEERVRNSTRHIAVGSMSA